MNCGTPVVGVVGGDLTVNRRQAARAIAGADVHELVHREIGGARGHRQHHAALDRHDHALRTHDAARRVIEHRRGERVHEPVIRHEARGVGFVETLDACCVGHRVRSLWT